MVLQTQPKYILFEKIGIQIIDAKRAMQFHDWRWLKVKIWSDSLRTLGHTSLWGLALVAKIWCWSSKTCLPAWRHQSWRGTWM